MARVVDLTGLAQLADGEGAANPNEAAIARDALGRGNELEEGGGRSRGAAFRVRRCAS